MTSDYHSPGEIAAMLTASALHVIADAHHIMAQGHLEQPQSFNNVTYDVLAEFVLSVRDGFVAGGDDGSVHSVTALISPAQDAAIARQILLRLVRWPAKHADEAAAWELALMPFLIDLASDRQRA